MATILVVDDEPNNRLLISTVLAHAKHRVLEAPDAQSALEITARTIPDLVLVDLSLSGMTGADLIKALRKDERTAGVRIALYTASIEGPLLRDFMELHSISRIVPKPADPQTILKSVEEALA